jgi:spermidine/putrescine ABC transporter ATP-binding subunit
MITIDRVSKRFGRAAAVDRVSLDIAPGEFFSLLGPSGCGKTTLLRMIGGFELPSEGEIVIDSVAMGSRRPHERPTNMVFQSYALFPHLTVEENIGYGLLNRRMMAAERRQTVAKALNMIRLDGLEARFPHQLSGGQRQRVALARALVCRPKVLLLDEPLGALDKALREEMQSELRVLQKTVGITFVFVTHDQEEAMALSDRIAVMARGKLLQVGSPRGIYEQPAALEVARFVGKANLLQCKVLGTQGEKARVRINGLGDLQVTIARSQHVAAGAVMHLLLRPEQLTVSAERPASSHLAFQARILSQTFLGNVERIDIEVGGHRLLADAPSLRPELPVLQAVWVSWPNGQGYLV